ncbi:MAG TPA: methyltransferase domain-containing protein [Acetobacteraceae bacterium]|nr:methyltransferase domain-containing protein [Acetobacteraceae bacterium]
MAPDTDPYAARDFPARRFQTAADHYLAGRPPYPPALIARLASLLAVAPTDRLLDLGCGPGHLALAFAPFAGEVIALDPEPAMLAIARSLTSRVQNIRVVPGGSRSLDQSLGRFRAVLIGRAFHWMDRADTLQKLDGLLEPDGAVLLFDDEHPKLPQNDWLRDYHAIVERFAEDDADRQRRKSDEFPSHVAVLLDSPFRHIETAGLIVANAVTSETLVERALSQSSTSRARLGQRAEPMIAEIRSATGAIAAVPRHEIIAWTAHIARRALPAI